MFNYKEEFVRNFETRLIEKYGHSVKESHITERYDILGEMVRDYASIHWKESKELANKNKTKKLFYFSMEFLIGRLLVNNMQNLGIYNIAKEGLASLNIDIHELENTEVDAGLGNGGLGRLAACYMDSLASLGYVGNGCSIRYDYGFFKQKIVDKKQIEVPDQWLTYGNVWEIRKPKHAVEITFFGHPEWYMKEDGSNAYRIVDAHHIRCVPYDVPIIGYRNQVTNTLRLWSAEPSEENLPSDISFKEYLNQIRLLTLGLYPDDSTEDGKMLRLKQQYFFVSASIQSIIRQHLRYNPNLDNFAKLNVFQLNDTHPILVIPELMRLLIDEHGYSWDDAYNIMAQTVAFTNHTVMQEALEQWPVSYYKKLLPRILLIIEEIDRRFRNEVLRLTSDTYKVESLAIISNGMIKMANLGVAAAFKVNGVAELHTSILKNDVFKGFDEIFKDKIVNITNGITHRRWLINSNPELTELIVSKIGDNWITKPEELNKFYQFSDDMKVKSKFLKIKSLKKKELAYCIKKNLNITIDENSMFDVQIKRLHAYKRQLLNVLNIIYLYEKVKENNSYISTPITFIFAAKAAPSYVFAKKVIELICSVAEVVNNDSSINSLLKVVFVPNYDVTKAEIIIPAADVSEQISTAGKEASGTGNMKLMLNGALTLGTMDGANVQIYELVGNKDIEIFGMNIDDIQSLNKTGYRSIEYYQNDEDIKMVINKLQDGTFGTVDNFKMIVQELLGYNDTYYLLKDFKAYIEAHKRVRDRYENKDLWAGTMIRNIAKAGYFSSDRSIEEYVEKIWKLKRLKK